MGERESVALVPCFWWKRVVVYVWMLCAYMHVRVQRCAYLAGKTRDWPRTIDIAFGGVLWWREGPQISGDAIQNQPWLLPGKMCQDLKGLEDLSRDILESSEKNPGDLYPDVVLHKMWWETPILCHHSFENITGHLFLCCAFEIWKGVAF